MAEDERLWEIKRQLHSFTKSPSLRHVRDPYFLDKLARDILKAVDRNIGPWEKWVGSREVILKSAAYTSIPIEDLRDYLNQLPGQKLTATDIAQRLRAMHEDSYTPYPDEALANACLEIYRRERELGTEMIAIIGLLEEYVEEERHRRFRESEQKRREEIALEKAMARERLLSGADCKWTQLDEPNLFFCRTNGRLYSLKRNSDKRWVLSRVKDTSDQKGQIIGVYAGKGEPTKVVQVIAYQNEPRW